MRLPKSCLLSARGSISCGFAWVENRRPLHSFCQPFRGVTRNSYAEIPCSRVTEMCAVLVTYSRSIGFAFDFVGACMK